MRLPALFLPVLVLAACSTTTGGSDAVDTAGAPAEGRATARLTGSNGGDMGMVTATATASGLRFAIEGRNVPPGPHGIHVHMVGRCDAPGFESAGSHWNPTSAQHGLQNPQGPHAGDLPNLLVGTDGRGSIEYEVPGATLAGLLDADGSAFMIHAAADDLRTDPSGNSGGRIACGVFAPA